MYCRTYLIQDVMTRLFWISQESISASISKISAIIRDRLPVPQRTHKVTDRLSEVCPARGILGGDCAGMRGGSLGDGRHGIVFFGRRVVFGVFLVQFFDVMPEL